MHASITLVRHAQSLWNQHHRFTGWTDIDLSEEGKNQSKQAGHMLIADNMANIDIVFTSVLKRAVRTAWIILDTMNKMSVPVMPDWRLNERHYGALQGENKHNAVAIYGQETIAKWRRSYHQKPPNIRTHTTPQQTWRAPLPPETESLEDTYIRVVDFIDTQLIPACQNYQNILIVAHGNSLRAIIKYFDHISDDEITYVEVPHAKPIRYIFNGHHFESIQRESIL